MPTNPMVIWLLIGAGLCLFELMVPTAFVAGVMGLSALLVALVAGFMPFNFQVVLWVLLSFLLVVLSRRLLRRSRPHHLDAAEAETLTEIAPGQLGRVLYEGNSWSARCEDDALTIAPQQRVYIVGRKGNTLIVLPQAQLYPGSDR